MFSSRSAIGSVTDWLSLVVGGLPYSLKQSIDLQSTIQNITASPGLSDL